MSSTPTTDQRNGCADPLAVAQRRPARSLGPVPGRGELDDHAAARVEQLAQPAQQRDRVAADADVAVGEQRGAPAALARQRREDVAAQRRRPRAYGLADGLAARRRCRGRRGRARPSASVSRPGPQPTSSVGPTQQRRAARGPRASAACVQSLEAQQPSRVEPYGSSPAAPPPRPRAKLADRGARRLRRPRRRPRAGVDVAQASRSCATPRPAPPERGRVSAYVVGVDIGTSRERRGRGRVAQREHPPAAVLGRPEHRVVRRPARRRRRAAGARRQLRGVHADLDDRAPGDVARGRWPAGRRSRRRAAGGPSSRPAPRASSSPRTASVEVAGQGEVGSVRRRTAAGAAARVSSSAAAATLGGRAPCRSRRRAGSSPGPTGALATTRTRRCHASTRQKSRAARAVPRTEPDTLERVPAARGW